MMGLVMEIYSPNNASAVEKILYENHGFAVAVMISADFLVAKGQPQSPT